MKEILNSNQAFYTKLLSEATYLKPNIAYFPSLQNHLIHGFSWGKGIPNYSYAKEPGFPSSESIDTVKARVSNFLTDLNLNKDENIFVLQAPITEENILDLKISDIKNFQHTDHGIFIKAGAVITTSKDCVLTVPPGDCRFGLIHAKTSDRQDLFAAIHHSREQLDSHFLTRVVNHLKNNYGCDPKEMKVGITPGISQKYHRLKFNGLKNPEDWKSHLSYEEDGYLHADILGYALAQYQSLGITQIEAYSNDVCTYKSALDGDFNASHRFSLDNLCSQKEGRILIAAKLK
jgi:copper oxidase (laccase) domain-containing protein